MKKISVNSFVRKISVHSTMQPLDDHRTTMKTIDKARFDTRLPKEHKDLFEYAAQLGGFRNLTDYVIHVLMEKSTLIIEKHNTVLASKRDQEVFFDAITKEIEPNTSLQLAASKYSKLIKKLNG